MKNKTLLLLITSVITGLTGCSKFLDEVPETSLSSTTFFKTESDFEQAVNATYVPLRSITNNYAWVLEEMHSDNAYYARNTLFGAVDNTENVADFAVPVSGSVTTNTYVLNMY
ncbi:MAG: hypothetical protein QM629_19070, partial [Parafilimonas sp.]